MIRRLDRATLRRGEVVPLAAQAPPRADDAPADEALHERVCRLLGAQIAKSPDNVRALVDESLARFAGASDVTLRAHPDDLAVLAPPTILAQRHRLAELPAIIADATLTRGGCLVQAECGRLDARIETRVTRALEGGAPT
jgi:flagellar biosynthesis/type III secretory pathway protein FliH